MLSVCYSNRFEQLAGALIEALVRERGAAGAGDPFYRSHVIVPTPQVAAYLQYELARATGIAAQVSFPYLDSFFAARLERARPDLALLDAGCLHALVCDLLADRDLLDEPVMGPVLSYLAAAADEDEQQRRRFQLAGRLASLFGEYALHRPALVASWETGPETGGAGEGGDGPGQAAWQRALWRRIFGPGGALDALAARGQPRRVLLPALFNQVTAAELALPAAVHLIGFSELAPAHRPLLAALAAATDLSVYALNPCMEFWEDVSRGDDRRRPDAPDAETPALALWGRAGRNTTRLLNELTGFDFEARFLDPANERRTLLTALQSDILHRRPRRTAPPERVTGDGSVRILACPNVRRELEIIGNEIRSLLAADRSLRLSDIALLIARGAEDRYHAHIASVFHELGDIPHHVVDMPLAADSRIGEALEMILELPFGSFTRPELLRVITHPAVIGRWHDVDAADWVHWSAHLGIVHGGDRSDHAGTYIERDLYNWEQGIRRLALGAYMAAAPSGDVRAVDFVDTAYIPEEVAPEDAASAARFSLLVRSLIADARYLAAERRPLAGWRRAFDAVATTYLTPRTEADRRALARCREAIAALEEIDLSGRPVGYRLACELARSRLRSLRTSRGEYLADGVMVAPLSPMRPIPFRVVFVAGLGEGRFPAAEREDGLDVRAGERSADDVSAADRDRHLFLETLLGARERLVLSYVARDETSGEALEPSAVVTELHDILERGYGAGEAAEPLVVTHPLRAFDPTYFPDLFADEAAAAPPASPAARAQAQALALRRDVEAHLRRAGRAIPSPEALRRAVDAAGFSDVRAALGIVATPAPAAVAAPESASAGAPESESASAAATATAPAAAGAPAPADESIALSLAMLRQFLESPVQAWARVVLRMRDDGVEDVTADRDEPFETDALATAILLRGAFLDWWRSGADAGDLLARYRQRARIHELTGLAPTGLFAELERARHRRWLENWQTELAAAGDRAPPPPRIYDLGRAREHDDVDALLPPIRLDLVLPGPTGERRRARVELTGRLDPLAVPAPDRSMWVELVRRPGRRHLLQGFLDHVALAAAGVRPDAPGELAIIPEDGRAARHRFSPWSQPDALAYLAALATDLLAAPHDYWLPAEAVLKWHRSGGGSAASLADALRRSAANAVRTGRPGAGGGGPVWRTEQLAPPPDAEAIARRRFGPLWASWEKPDG